MAVGVGIINYLNVQPINYKLAERLAGRDVYFRAGVPTELNQALLAGEIAIAPISAIEAARHADEVVVVPHLGIATLGAVKTVLLFSWLPDPAELDGKWVALTDHSATSVALLQVLCTHYYRVAPRYRTTFQHLSTMLDEAQAALIIGDDALIEGVRRRALGERGVPYVFDLGDEWLKWTGLPFTFAVWAARRDQLDALLHAGVIEALYASKGAGLSHLDEIAFTYAPRLGLAAGVCRKYLRDLRYDLSASDITGLQKFLTFALAAFDIESLCFWFPASRTIHPVTELLALAA